VAGQTDVVFEGLRRICVMCPPSAEPPRLASAETEPAFAKAFGTRYAAIRDGVQSLLAQGQENGSFRADFDPVAQCDVLCALVDGLALHAVSEPSRFPSGRIVTLVTQELEKLRR
jgi:TetR/AcrR family transcriptional regulator, transcriptional repressor of bet genes